MSLRTYGQRCYIVWMIASLLVRIEKGLLYRQDSRAELHGGEDRGSLEDGRDVLLPTPYEEHKVRHEMGMEELMEKWVKLMRYGRL